MEYYCGIDVSLEQPSVCVVDAEGSIVREATVASDPDALLVWFSDLGLALSRIGLEAGPLSQWLYAGLAKAGLAVELIETRHVRDAFKAMPIKINKKDARGIAQLMRLGWFRSVHCKSLPAQEIRAVLTARKLVQAKLHDVEMSLRGILRGFGLKIGHTTPRTFDPCIRELVEGHPTLTTIADALLAAGSVLHREFQGFERRVRSLARRDDRARLLMSAPRVGVCLVKDRDTLLAFYDVPAEHWQRVRSTNPIESTFSTVRLRTNKTRCCPSRDTALAMVVKLVKSAERHWRRLNGTNRLGQIIEGIKFRDGEPIEETKDHATA